MEQSPAAGRSGRFLTRFARLVRSYRPGNCRQSEAFGGARVVEPRPRSPREVDQTEGLPLLAIEASPLTTRIELPMDAYGRLLIIDTFDFSKMAACFFEKI